MVGTLWKIEMKQSGGGKFYIQLYTVAEDRTVEGVGWSPEEAYRHAVSQLSEPQPYLPKELQIG